MYSNNTKEHSEIYILPDPLYSYRLEIPFLSSKEHLALDEEAIILATDLYRDHMGLLHNESILTPEGINIWWVTKSTLKFDHMKSGLYLYFIGAKLRLLIHRYKDTHVICRCHLPSEISSVFKEICGDRWINELGEVAHRENRISLEKSKAFILTRYKKNKHIPKKLLNTIIKRVLKGISKLNVE